MADDFANSKYGLSPKEARMIGLDLGRNEAVSKDVEIDTVITRRIRAMGADHVHVRVKNGKVTLSGMCDDFGQKRAIVSVVKGMPGIGKVVNQIKVIPGDTGRPGRG